MADRIILSHAEMTLTGILAVNSIPDASNDI